MSERDTTRPPMRAAAWAVLIAVALLTVFLGVYARGWPSDNRVQTWTRHGARDATYEDLVRGFGGDEVVLLRVDGFPHRDARAAALLDSLGARVARLPAVRGCADPLHLPGVRLAVGQDPIELAAEQPIARALDLVDASRPRVDFVLAIDASAPEPQRAALSRAIAGVIEDARATGLRVRAAGHPLIAAALDEEAKRVEDVFAPLLAVAALAAVWIALRSLPLALVTLLFAVLASVGVRAALRAVGWPSNLILVSSGPLCFVIVLATVLHIVAGWKRRYAAGLSPREAARETVRSLGWPAFYAALTTAIGFGVFVFSSIETVRQLGIAAALAVVVFVPIAYLGVPYLLAGLPLARPAEHHADTRKWGRLPIVAWRRRKLVWFVSALVLVAGAIAPFQLRRNTDALEYFPRGHDLRESFKSIEAEGGSLSTLDVLVQPAKGDHSPSLEYARGTLARDVAALDGVRGVFGPETILAQVEKTAGPAAVLALPAALRAALRAAGRVDESGGTYRWTVRIQSGGVEHVEDLAQRVRATAERWASARGDRAPRIDVTGTLLRVLGMQKSLTGTLVSSMALNIAATVLLFFLVVKSVREITAALVANLFPVAAALAAAWALRLELDAATVMVFSVVLGLGVDNTFHLLLAAGSTRERARTSSVVRSYRVVGHPASVSSLALVLGFGVLTLSGFAPTARFGGLTALGIAAALFGALMVLPSIWLTRSARSRSAESRRTPA